jgi:hypothetical protein
VEETAHLHLLSQGCRRRRGTEAVGKGKMGGWWWWLVERLAAWCTGGGGAGGRRPSRRVMSLRHASGVERWRAPLLRDARDDDESRWRDGWATGGVDREGCSLLGWEVRSAKEARVSYVGCCWAMIHEPNSVLR